MLCQLDIIILQRQDLGAESIDGIELMAAFEAEFDIEIPPEKGERVQTVGETADYIKKKLKEKTLAVRIRAAIFLL